MFESWSVSSVWDGKNIPTGRISVRISRKQSQIIEEENSEYSRRISYVASTPEFTDPELPFITSSYW